MRVLDSTIKIWAAKLAATHLMFTPLCRCRSSTEHKYVVHLFCFAYLPLQEALRERDGDKTASLYIVSLNAVYSTLFARYREKTRCN